MNIIVGILSLLISIKYPQKPKEGFFRQMLKECNLVYSPPSEYIGCDTFLNINYNSLGVSHTVIRHGLKSIKDSIFIGIALSKINTNDNLRLKGFPGPTGKQWDANENFYPAYKVPYKLYNEKYVSQNFNGDIAGIYEFKLNPKYPFMKKYSNCLIVFVHKNNIADFEVIYCYNDDSKNKIEKLIAQTKTILKFRS